MTIAKLTIHDALTRLAECFPQTFGRENPVPPPLKVGIAADILARCPELDRRVLSVALAYFTRRAVYLQSMVAGAARIDLDGNPCGEVSADAAAHAAARLAEILALREAGQTLVAASRAARITRPAAAAPPSATEVAALKAKPVLRLPAFRRQAGGG